MIFSSDRSHTLMALLDTLSEYAGPIPRFVVPILSFDLSDSLISSIILCIGRIKVAFSAMINLSGVTVSPFSSIFLNTSIR